MGLCHVQRISLVLIIFVNVIQRTSFQTIIVDLTDGEILCPGREIVFRCEVPNSQTIAWRSNEYIQQNGNTIMFASYEDLTKTKSNPENPTTIATFVNKSSNTLVSDLRIIVSSVYPTPSVTCLHDNGTGVSESFKVTTPPGVPSEMILSQIVNVSESCVLHLLWSSPESSALSHYMIYLNGEHVVKNKTHTNSSWQLFAYPVCTCGSHNVSIRAVNRCGNIGPSIYNQSVVSIELPVVPCPREQSHQTTTNTLCPEVILEPQTQSALIGGIIFLVIVAVFFIITTIVFLFTLLCLKSTSDNRRQGTESDNVNQFNETQSGDIKDDSSKNTGLQKRKKIEEAEL